MKKKQEPVVYWYDYLERLDRRFSIHRGYRSAHKDKDKILPALSNFLGRTIKIKEKT